MAPPERGLVGRRRELHHLREALSAATAGRGSVVVLTGEPGIGKTRLARQVADDAAERGVLALWGLCREAGAAPSFWPWVQIARQLIDRLDPGAPFVAEVRALAEMSGVAHDASLSPSQRFARFDGVTRALAAAGPAVVIVEDLHRADPPSLLLFEHVADSTVTAPLLLLATARDTAEPGLEVGRDRTWERVRLDGLDRDDVGALARSLDVHLDADEAADVRTRTGGNPLFVTELVRLGGPGVPSTVADVVRARLAALPAATVDALALAAVVGRDIDLGLVAAVAGTTVAEVDDRLRHARAAHLVERDAFVHAVVADVLVDDLDATRRADLHRDVAAALLARDPEPTGEQLAVVAFHLREASAAHVIPEAAVWLGRAARDAIGRLAFEDALHLLDDALALQPTAAASPEERFELTMLAGDALQRAGHLDEARARFGRGATIARRLDRADLLARAALGVDLTIVASGRTDHELVDLLEDALAAQPAHEPATRARLLARLALERYWEASGERGRALAREAVAAATSSGDEEALARARFALLFTLRGPDATLAERIGLGEQLVATAGADPASHPGFQAFVRLASDVLEGGDVVRYRSLVDEIERRAGAANQPVWRWWALMHLGCRALLDADLAAFASIDEEFAGLGEAFGPGPTPVYRVAWRLMVERDRGDAAVTLDAIRDLAVRFPAFATLRGLEALAGVRADPDATRRLVAHWASRVDDVPRDALWLTTMAHLGEAAAEVGEPELAARFGHELTVHRGRFIVQGTPACWGAVDRPLGVIATAAGDLEAARALLSDAARLHQEAGCPALVARSLADLADATRAAGDEGSASDAATRAAAIARDHGLAAIAARLEPQTAHQPPTPLSPRELEIVTLVAAGAQNRQVAETLHISVHTVERHLANVYLKLGVRGRAEAVAHAIRTGLV